MSPSNRLRISISRHRYHELSQLAEHADRTVNDEARTLLEHAIGTMVRRISRIYGPGAGIPAASDPEGGYRQPLLPDMPPAEGDLEERLRAVRERLIKGDEARHTDPRVDSDLTT